MKVKVLVDQLCLILCDPMDCSLLGSFVHGISQAQMLEWIAIPFSKGPSQLSDWTWVSCISGGFFTIWAVGKAPQITYNSTIYYGLPWWLRRKACVCSAGDPDSIPGSGTSPGEGNGNPLQYSCLENPMYRGAW